MQNEYPEYIHSFNVGVFAALGRHAVVVVCIGLPTSASICIVYVYLPK